MVSSNVFVWWWDWEGNYQGTAQSDPTGPLSGEYRVVCGGSWNREADLTRSAYQSYSLRMATGSTLSGFAYLIRDFCFFLTFPDLYHIIIVWVK